ncbi:hypothetical protein CsSME_00001732 [Camellia sinensis var. sinensis]
MLNAQSHSTQDLCCICTSSHFSFRFSLECFFLFTFLNWILIRGTSQYGMTLLSTPKYEALLGGEHVCPERDASIFSRICFGWMTPLMLQGYKRPITENDVWKLDTWDETETLIKKFHICWAEESQRPKPWLLRALNNSLGGRFWFGGLFNSMERGDPAWVGYIYAFSIFVGVSVGVLCEAQYYQNVLRVGFRLRSTLQICQQLHGLWSAPFHIIIAMVLLYQQLGAASLPGSLMLALMFPIQTFIISKMRKLSKEGLQRTDKRVGLMNEILAAMDTVKCYAWEESFQSKVHNIRFDELS